MFSFGFLLWLISIPVLATTEFSSAIYEIDLATDDQNVNLVLLANGKVVKIPNAFRISCCIITTDHI